MKRITLLSALMLAVAVFFTATAFAQSTLRRSYDDLDIDIWTDKDDGTNYYEGDEVTIYFRASRDCYVTIYDLDTRGNINLLFPAEPRDNNYIQGDAIYMIPDRYDDYTLTLEGPPGNEHIQIVASLDYHAPPDWRGPMSVYDDDWGFKFDGDNDDFIVRVNSKYFPDDVCAYDNVSFYVAPRYYYEPEKNDCYGDCGQVYIDYPNGCEVYVNGVFFGYAPLYIPSIYLGRHRVTVYWGASIVYNDWIFVDAWHPYFVYTRPHYVYDFCFTHYYRHHVWDTWYDGPSRYKYKDRDFYTYKKPESRRGYKVVSNAHSGYGKSKTYLAEKTKRIEKYKATYNYDKSTRTFTNTKGRADVQKGKTTTASGKKRDYDSYNSKGSSGSDGSYGKSKGSSDSGSKSKGSSDSKGKSGGEVKKPVKKSDDGKSGGKSKQSVGSSGSSGKKSSPSTSSGSSKSSSGNSGSKSGSSDKSGGKSGGGKKK